MSYQLIFFFLAKAPLLENGRKRKNILVPKLTITNDTF